MTSMPGTKVFISKVTHAVKELLDISFYIDPNDRGKGYVRDIIFVSFTPSIENSQSSSGYSFDTSRRESMSFNHVAIRALAAAMEDTANRLLRGENEEIRVPYKKFTDSSKSQHNTQDGGRKLLTLQGAYHKERPMVILHYTGIHGQKTHISFDAYEAMGFAGELRWHADEMSRQMAHFQQQRDQAFSHSA